MANYVAAAAVVGAAALASPLIVPALVSAVGFGTGGIVAGSSAAAFMSTYGGAVASGSVCATLQSIGAAGLGATGTATAAAVGGSVAAAAEGVAAVLIRAYRKKGTPPPPDSEIKDQDSATAAITERLDEDQAVPVNSVAPAMDSKEQEDAMDSKEQEDEEFKVEAEDKEEGQWMCYLAQLR